MQRKPFFLVALALLAGSFAVSGCTKRVIYYGAQPEPGGNPCGAHGILNTEENTCTCEVGYDFCTEDPEDYSCCPLPGTGDETTPAGECRAALVAGICQGTVLTWCEDGVTLESNCGDYGMQCGWDDLKGWNDCLGEGGPGGGGGDTDLPSCNNYPAQGWCENTSTRAYCALNEAGDNIRIFESPCNPGDICQDAPEGPLCVLPANVDCHAGQSRCQGEHLQTCEAGAWRLVTCQAGCRANAGGAECLRDDTLQSYHGRLTYDFRRPNAGYTNWGGVETGGADRVLLLSYAGDELVDVAVTGTGDKAGTFEIGISGDGDESIIALLAWLDDEGNPVFSVVEPDLSPGEHEVLTRGREPAPWGWAWSPGEYPDGNVHIPESVGSGAIRVYSVILHAWLNAQSTLRRANPETLIVWMTQGVTWDCGACFVHYPSNAPWPADSQIWIGMSDRDQAYWGDAVNLHEAGHYVMDTYGPSIQEAGTHYLGIPVHPGMALSEGWGTYHSSALRNSPINYDKQGGGFFWLDLSRRSYSSSTPWQRPQAGAGLTQVMDENEVAAILFALDRAHSDGLSRMLQAIASSRMTTAPYLRGYTQRIWTDPTNPSDYRTTRQSTPMLADMLDALLCEGLMTASTIDAVTQPATHYPYPSNAPLCR